MPTDVNRLLNEMQTGEYIPTEEEKILMDQMSQVPPVRRRIGDAAIQQLTFDPYDTMRQDSIGLEAAAAGYGGSRYDTGEFVPGEDLENRRAIAQPGIWKIANGAAKGGIYAGTTAVETVAGVIDGLLEGTYELARQIAEGDKVSPGNAIGKGVNNFTARTMNNIQRLSDEWFPNYRTTEERSEEYQKNWQRHIFSANFIGDSFLKNFGFTVGALAGGMAWTKVLNSAMKAKTAGDLMKGVTAAAEGNEAAMEALNTTRNLIKEGAAKTVDDIALQKSILNSARSLNKLPVTKQLFGSVISAMGEGTMEGVMARNEFLENYTDKLNSEYLEAMENARGNLIQELQGTDKVRAVPMLDENGDLVNGWELNDAGEEILKERLDDLASDYYNNRQRADEVADKVATSTLVPNLLILSASNVFQFGRMFSGGWKTTRNALTKVGGGITAGAGEVAANYVPIANKAARVASNALKLGSSEAAEEMAQGFVSSGSKKAAEVSMTSFNDDGYDENTLKRAGAWIGNMLEGGGEYLSDWANWQEGFLGLITGLVGMPGKTWGGGIAEAVRSTKDDMERSSGAAEALNNRINSDKFKNTWKGYVRHMKYEADMADALANDDQYTWQNRNDEQLISDIILFADAGRLQDLKDIVDVYANMSNEEAENLGVVDAVVSEANETEVRNNPTAVINKVKEQAEAIKQGIETYSELYNELAAKVPVGTEGDHLKEMIATSMNIKGYEKRFLTMFDEVIKGLDKYVKPLAMFDKEGNELKTDVEQLARAKDIYSYLADIYTGTGIPIDTHLTDAVDIMASLSAIDQMVNKSGDTELIKKYNDMKKVSVDRKNSLRKLLTLQNISSEEYNKQAKNADSVASDLKTQKAKAETAVLDSVDKIKSVYLDKNSRDRELFANTIRDASKDDSNAKEFMKMHDTFMDFKNALKAKYPNLIKKSTGDLSAVAETVLDKLFNDSNNEADLVNKLDTPLMTLGDVNGVFTQRVANGMMSEDEALPMMVEVMYNAATAAIADTAREFKSSWNSTNGREDIKKSEDTKTFTDDNANPVPATKPVVENVKPAQETSRSESVPAVEKIDKDKDETPEPVERIPVKEASDDSNSTFFDNNISENEAYRRDDKGTVKLGHYQQSIPEIPTGVASEVRELLKKRKTASKEEMDAIDERLSYLDLSDFVVFDENGKAVGGEGLPEGYDETYKWLQDNGAFKYISTQLKKDDQVVLAIIDGAPKYENESQIFVSVVKERNQNGEITSVQPLTPLHLLKTQAGNYLNLDDLYDAIYEDYDSSEPEGELYIFGGKKNPKTSRVFGKRPGLIRYDRSENGSKRIDKITDYDPDAPIMIIDENNSPVFLRGNVDASKVFMPNIYEWSSDHYGRVYYLVPNGNDTYTPILIEKETVTSDAVQNAPDTGYLANVKRVLSEIDGITDKLSADSSVDDLNNRLKSKLKTLNEYLNIDGISFEYAVPGNANVPALNVKWGKDGENSAVVFGGESVIPLLDVFNRPARLSPKDQWFSSSRKNLQDIIDAGLLTSNALELRQVGVNFMFDPWDKKTNTFRRILPSEYQERSIPQTTKQNIASDAELGTSMSVDEIADISQSQKVEELNDNSEADKSLDDVLNDAVPNTDEVDFALDYDDQPEQSRKVIESKGISKKTWDRFNEDVRRQLLGCM